LNIIEAYSRLPLVIVHASLNVATEKRNIGACRPLHLKSAFFNHLLLFYT
jgi:hypothetical protein